MTRTDPLSNLLSVVRLDGAYFYPVEATEPWGVESVGAAELRPRILPSAEHLIAYHLLLSGRCYGGLVGEEQVELRPGDAIIFPHGDANVMSSGRGVRSGPNLITSPARFPEVVRLGGNGSRVTTFVCGFLGCDRRPHNPLLAALPRQMHVRAMSDTWPESFTRQLIDESHLRRPGADTVLTRLAELMFIEAVRRYLQELRPGQTGWLAGLNDEVVGRALALMHDRPGHPWTLADLAREASSSRSNLSRRFTELIGESPMHYLLQWRIQVAANRLIETSHKIATIGSDIGYDSDAAFSRAFKKQTGLAPGAWRHTRRRGQVEIA